MGQRDGGWSRNGLGNDRAALCVVQGGFEISDAVVEHVQQAQQLQLVGRVAPPLRNREASVQGHTAASLLPRVNINDTPSAA
jgi:hypothetical protein